MGELPFMDLVVAFVPLLLVLALVAVALGFLSDLERKS